ncbi:MAG: hypothetical protein ACT452_05445, partial [Microthrixaceae bacterium]
PANLPVAGASVSLSLSYFVAGVALTPGGVAGYANVHGLGTITSDAIGIAHVPLIPSSSNNISLQVTPPTGYTSFVAAGIPNLSVTSDIFIAVIIQSTDVVPPIIQAILGTPAPPSGWFNHPVTVGFACTDADSGIATCTPTQTVSQEGAGIVVEGSALDHAGNTAAMSTTLNIDLTAPTVAAVPPPPNSSGWYNTDVTVPFSCADALSGVATCTSPVTITGEGTGLPATGSASDLAGNTASTTTSVSIDRTTPTISAAITTPVAGGGWYRGPVTVHFTCADALSGLATCPDDIVVSTPGAAQSVTGTALDQAGNAAAVTVSGINIDVDGPAVMTSLSVQPNANGWWRTAVTASVACADPLSGIAFCPAAQGFTSEGAGQSWSAQASDVAGNTTPVSVSGINIDLTAPTVGITSGDATVSASAAGGASILGAAGDNLSGVATVSVAFTDATGLRPPIVSTATLQCSPDHACTWSAAAPTAIGVWSARATSTDLAGNQATSAPVTVIVI